MNVLVKAAATAAAIALSSQPCVAAEGQRPSLAASMTASAVDRVDFNLKTHVSAEADYKTPEGLALTPANTPKSTAAVQDVEERKPRGMSKGATTGLIIGALVAVAAIVVLGTKKADKPFRFPDHPCDKDPSLCN
ncbi:MAG TPA: hypothetical protein VGW38_04520 [Chloroflexota bacterium]|nr:hypothetical protein [Chloroflexota bacterium]